jgi:glycerol-3-phosphate acyltransferase PlsY
MDASALLPLTGFLAAGYACGSVPFGVIVARSKGVDILREGSGNPGATNVGRVLGKRFGYAVFALDALKGALPVLGARLLAGDALAEWAPAAALAGAVLGHVFSPFLGFRGGKGVATGAGAFAVLLPVPAAVALATWLVALAAGRFVSVASMLAACSLPVSALLTGAGPGFVILCAVVAAFVVFLHRGNIARLRAGTEPRVGAARKTSTP